MSAAATIAMTRTSDDRWVTDDGYSVLRQRKSSKGAYRYTVFAPEARRAFDGSRLIVCYEAQTLRHATNRIVLDRKEHARNMKAAQERLAQGGAS